MAALWRNGVAGFGLAAIRRPPRRAYHGGAKGAAIAVVPWRSAIENKENGGKITRGGITRAKEHLMIKPGNVAGCKMVPKDVIAELWEFYNQKKKSRKTKFYAGKH
ncbi:hypothetical protein HN51_056755 [Arachis hypogaea]